MKLRAAVKKGKAIYKQRADMEAQLLTLQQQVPHPMPAQTCSFIYLEFPVPHWLL